MARGDPLFARLDLALFADPRFRGLTAAGKIVYLGAYTAAVEARSELLPTWWTPRALADRTGTDERTAKLALKNAIAAGLIQEPVEGRYRVVGVRENHEKLEWRELRPDSPHGADSGLREEREEREEREGKENEGRAESMESRALGNPPPSPAACSPGVREAPARALTGGNGSVIGRLSRQLNANGPNHAPSGKSEREPSSDELAHLVSSMPAALRDSPFAIAAVLVTGRPGGKLPADIQEMLSSIPAQAALDVCRFVYAKANVNRWQREMTSAVLSARLRDARARVPSIRDAFPNSPGIPSAGQTPGANS